MRVVSIFLFMLLCLSNVSWGKIKNSKEASQVRKIRTAFRLAKKNKTDEALKLLTRVFRQRAANEKVRAQALEVTGYIFRKKRQHTKAIHVYKKLIKLHHGERYLKSQNLDSLKSKLRYDRKSRRTPPKKSIKFYFHLASSYHRYQENLVDDDKINTIKSLAIKYYIVSQFYKYRRKQSKNAIRELTRNVVIPTDDGLEEDASTRAQDIAQKSRNQYFIGYGLTSWQEPRILSDEEGGEVDLLIQVKAHCVGGGIIRKYDSYDLSLKGCALFGTSDSAVDTSLSNFAYSVADNSTKGVFGTIGISWRPKIVNGAIGPEVFVLYRSTDWKQSTDYVRTLTTDRPSLFTMGITLEARYETKWLSFFQKIGHTVSFSSLFWMTGAHFNF